eukprot:13812882-Alexandrium_andersonii.AAC.1
MDKSAANDVQMAVHDMLEDEAGRGSNCSDRSAHLAGTESKVVIGYKDEGEAKSGYLKAEPNVEAGQESEKAAMNDKPEPNEQRATAMAALARRPSPRLCGWPE